MHIAIHETLDGKPLYPCLFDFNIRVGLVEPVLDHTSNLNVITIVDYPDQLAADTFHNANMAIQAIDDALASASTPHDDLPMAADEFGRDAYYADWLWACRQTGPNSNDASDGTRVTSAKALQIAADVLHHVLEPDSNMQWDHRDLKLALGAIAGIRAQRGEWEDEPNCTYLTHYMDIAIYG